MALPSTKFRVEGLRELDQALGQLPRSVAGGVLNRVLRKAAKPILDEARARAPKRTGRLARSLVINARLAKSQRGEAETNHFRQLYVGSAGAPHAHLLEFGTSRMSARPFLRPAFDAKGREALQILVEELGTEIEQAAARLARNP